MRNYILITLLGLLAACTSIQPEHQKIDNEQVFTSLNCDELKQAIQDKNSQLADLQIQKKKANAGNAVSTVAALISLNPFALLDNERTGNLDKAIEEYTKRLTLLKKLEAEKCQLL